MKFELDTTDGRARRGRLVFDRGVVETPCFMPVGTYGTVKGMTPEEVEATGSWLTGRFASASNLFDLINLPQRIQM